MRLWIPLILLILHMGSLSMASARAISWRPLSLPGVDQAWSADSKAYRLVTSLQNQSAQELSFEDRPVSEVAAGLIGMRFLTLGKLGFTEIQVGDFQLTRDRQASVITISGHYVTPERASVYFFERQTYRGKKFSQISYFVQKKSITSAETREAQKILRAFAEKIQRTPASEPVSTEAAGFCPECLTQDFGLSDLKTQTENLKATAEMKTEPAAHCAQNTFIDPHQKSILQEKKAWLEKVGLGGQTENPALIAGRSAVTCIYGAGKGIYNSIKDLVESIPALMGWTWKGLKAAKNGIQNADYTALMSNFAPQTLWENGKKAYRVTRDTVAEAYNASSEKVFNSYKEGGATGAVAAVAQAAYQSSPHRIVGRFLADFGAKVAEAIGNEWSSFKCLDAETMSQMVCQVAAYIMTDIYSGHLIISGLAKSARFKDALKAVRAVMFRDKKAVEALRSSSKLEDSAAHTSLAEIGRSIEDLKKAEKVDVEVARASEETFESVQKISTRIEDHEALDFNLLRTAMEEARSTGQTDALGTLKKAYDSLNEVGGGEGKLSKESLKVWEKKLKSENPDLSPTQIEKAKQCLFLAK